MKNKLITIIIALFIVLLVGIILVSFYQSKSFKYINWQKNERIKAEETISIREDEKKIPGEMINISGEVLRVHNGIIPNKISIFVKTHPFINDKFEIDKEKEIIKEIIITKNTKLERLYFDKDASGKLMAKKEEIDISYIHDNDMISVTAGFDLKGEDVFNASEVLVRERR